MTVAQQTPPTPAPVAPSDTTSRNGRWTGFRYLLMARLLELKREPEVIFWVFGFPLLLATGLGIAFRNKPADVTPVAIVAGPGADNAVTLLQGSPRDSSIRAAVVAEPEALQGFRLGKYDLVVLPDGKGSFQYRYDPARPESVLSRAEVDDALQSGAGRKDPVPTSAVASRVCGDFSTAPYWQPGGSTTSNSDRSNNMFDDDAGCATSAPRVIHRPRFSARCPSTCCPVVLPRCRAFCYRPACGPARHRGRSWRSPTPGAASCRRR